MSSRQVVQEPGFQILLCCSSHALYLRFHSISVSLSFAPVKWETYGLVFLEY